MVAVHVVVFLQEKVSQGKIPGCTDYQSAQTRDDIIGCRGH